jgi:hypothetical protein
MTDSQSNSPKPEQKDKPTVGIEHRTIEHCILCNLPSYSEKICKNCQYALFQIKELKDVLVESLKNGKAPPEWASRAAEKITEVLTNYFYFSAYKNVVSEIVLIYILDDDAIYNGIEIEEVTSLRYTAISRDQIIKDLYEFEIIDVTNDRRLYPGKILQALIDVKKVLGDNFASFNWKIYTLSVQAVFILGLVERQLYKYINEETRLPRVPLAIFKLLSLIIQKYKESSSDEINKLDEFRLLDIELNTILSILGSKFSKDRFYVNITGIVDGNAKLIEDYDEEKGEFVIHKDLNDYIKIMIERIREVERERER